MKKLKYLLLLLFFITLFSCKKESENKNIDELPNVTGLLPSNIDSILKIPVADTVILFNRRIAQLPTSFALEMPPIENQGGEGSCVAFSSAYAARSFHLHRDLNTSYTNTNGTSNFNNLFSPEFLYNSAKAQGDCASAGMYFYNALDYLKNNGVCKWSTMPYSSTNGCTTLPNNNQIQEAAQFKISNYFRISDISIDNIKSMIYNQQPIIFGANLDQGFMSANSSFIWKEQIGSFVGRHAMVLCGWDDDKNAFKIMNSWGKNIADNGFYWVDYDYLDNILMGSAGAYEMYVLQTTSSNNVVDIDGNVYHTINIGTQTWMVENLKVTRFRNGDLIPNVSDSIQWSNLSSGALCFQFNNPSLNNPYGKLYNYYAVNDQRKICPVGWHIPSKTEWETLFNFLGGNSIAGGKLKRTDLWFAPNTGASNSSGFSAVPSSLRNGSNFNGLFSGIGYYNDIWSSTEENLNNAWAVTAGSYDRSDVQIWNDTKQLGLSVRCIKD